MKVLLAGAHGRLGSRVLALLVSRGHGVRALVRTEGQADALRSPRVEPVVVDLRGDVEWVAGGCDATVFAAGARHRTELGAIDAGGAAKIAEAAYRYEHTRFLLCSVIGADHPERRSGGVRDFLAAKHQAEHRVSALEMRWIILRFGRLTEAPGTERIATTIGDDAPLTLSRDDAALAIAYALDRPHLVRQAIPVIDGDRTVADALDAIPPLALPASQRDPTGPTASLGAAQSDNPPDAADMIAADAAPLDADVDWEGDGPVAAEPVGNEDPAPGMP